MKRSSRISGFSETTEPTAVNRADAVRSRLIDTFSLIDHLRGLSQAVPRHNLREFLDPARERKLMLGDHHQLVRFSVRPGHDRIRFAQRQQCRLTVRCNRWAPLSLWAGWVLERPLFINLVNTLIFLNTVLLMIEIEIVNTTNIRMLPVMVALEVGSWFILIVFMLEIILLWLYNFFNFWKSAWNLFDFFVTMMSLLPEIVVLTGTSGESVWMQLLRICRVLRSLKLFARFRQIRVIILALVRALKTMTFLLVLLLIFFYIFALTGIYFFESYSRSDMQDLDYQMYFINMPNSLVTVFILFTLDHWYALLQDAWKVADISKTFTSLYVILWLLIGSIIFRNIIVAMMGDFARQMKEKRSPEVLLNFDSPGLVDWETHVHQNLHGLMEMDQDERVVWPRDSLFRYFELLEKLQYNIEERKQLQEFAVKALINLKDN